MFGGFSQSLTLEFFFKTLAPLKNIIVVFNLWTKYTILSMLQFHLIVQKLSKLCTQSLRGINFSRNSYLNLNSFGPALRIVNTFQPWMGVWVSSCGRSSDLSPVLLWSNIRIKQHCFQQKFKPMYKSIVQCDNYEGFGHVALYILEKYVIIAKILNMSLWSVLLILYERMKKVMLLLPL